MKLSRIVDATRPLCCPFKKQQLATFFLGSYFFVGIPPRSEGEFEKRPLAPPLSPPLLH